MTPTTLDRIVRSCLQAILQGEGTLDERIDTVMKKLETLPSSDRVRVARSLKPKLARALRQKTATLTTSSPLSPAIKESLQKFSTSRGMIFTQEQTDEKLLAGFSLQLGDDRLNLSLLNRLESL